MTQEQKIEIFSKAFLTDCLGIRRSCVCGKEWFVDDEHAGDWEDGELEHLRELEKQGKTFSLDSYIEIIEFEGCEYVASCNCWHEKAIQFMSFLDAHKNCIEKYFAGMKQDKRSRDELN